MRFTPWRIVALDIACGIVAGLVGILGAVLLLCEAMSIAAVREYHKIRGFLEQLKRWHEHRKFQSR